MFVNDALGRIIKKAKDTSSNQQKSEAEIEEKDSEKCSHHFGYLVKHPRILLTQRNVFFASDCWNARCQSKSVLKEHDRA